MLTGVPAAAQFIMQIFNPESPTYLVVQCKDPEAGKAALRQLASMTDAEAEEATRRILKDADSSSGQLPIVWKIKKIRLRIVVPQPCKSLRIVVETPDLMKNFVVKFFPLIRYSTVYDYIVQ